MHVHLCIRCVPDTHGDQKRVSDPLLLDAATDSWKCICVPGIKPCSLGRAASTFNCWDISFACLYPFQTSQSVLGMLLQPCLYLTLFLSLTFWECGSYGSWFLNECILERNIRLSNRITDRIFPSHSLRFIIIGICIFNCVHIWVWVSEHI